MQATLAERGIDTSKYDRTPENFLALPTVDSLRSVVAEDIWEHGRLQQRFDAALGRRYRSKDMLTRSYNPVSDRWRIEKLRHAGDKEGEEAYKNEIRRNMVTNLRERLQVGESIINYRIKGNDIYSEDFPGESFTEVLHRGAAYRLAHGSEETEREGMKGELGGWEKIRDKFTNPDTPVGTKLTIFSPPGMVKDSAYDRQLVDEHELAENDEGRYWKVTRKIVDFDDADYDSAALSHDPHYFDEYDGRPLDAWYLSHPVEGTLPDLKIKGMKSAIFDKIYQDPMLQGMNEKYIDDVSSEAVNWKLLALDINAILNQVDAREKEVLYGKKKEQPIYISPDVIHAAVQRLGRQTPTEKGGAGCPTNKGYSLGNSIFPSSINSVSSYSTPGGGVIESCPEIKCKHCPWKANDSQVSAIQAGSITECPNCGRKP